MYHEISAFHVPHYFLIIFFLTETGIHAANLRDVLVNLFVATKEHLTGLGNILILFESGTKVFDHGRSLR